MGDMAPYRNVLYSPAPQPAGSDLHVHTSLSLSQARLSLAFPTCLPVRQDTLEDTLSKNLSTSLSPSFSVIESITLTRGPAIVSSHGEFVHAQLRGLTPGPSVFDLSLSGRPGTSEAVGRWGETETRKQSRAPGARPQNAERPSARGGVTDVTDVTDGMTDRQRVKHHNPLNGSGPV